MLIIIPVGLIATVAVACIVCLCQLGCIVKAKASRAHNTNYNRQRGEEEGRGLEEEEEQGEGGRVWRELRLRGDRGTQGSQDTVEDIKRQEEEEEEEKEDEDSRHHHRYKGSTEQLLKSTTCI